MVRTIFATALATLTMSAASASPISSLPTETQAWLATSSDIIVSTEVFPMTQTKQPAVSIRGAQFGGGFIQPTITGTLKNGQEVAIIPLLSGGSMGVADALVFTKLHGHRKFVGDLPTPGGHLLVNLTAGMIQTSVAIYGMGDSMATPSKRYVTRYSLNGIRLVRVSGREVSTK